MANDGQEAHRRPVVFVGPYEHHSNLIPWRETGCEIVMIPECTLTHSVDVSFLDRMLQKTDYNERLKIGTFSAASNVTGTVSDVDQIAATLHRHGALAFFDYATACSYTKIDMNPAASDKYPNVSLVAKDAVFFSPHKMLGGVGTPGVLIVKKSLVNQVNAPSRSGGGTVFYVTNTHHRFLSNRIERYEGGTPNVSGITRVGLAFLLKRQTEIRYKSIVAQLDGEQCANTPATIEDYDCDTYVRVAAHLKEHALNLVLLGNNNGARNLPIFSFLIRFGQRFLHYNYVCAILNDVFGIQSRGGCQCAGPYSQRLLGLVDESSDGDVPNFRNVAIEDALVRHKELAELLRPGYSRLSLPFKGTMAMEMDYVMKALVWVSKNGWALMCQYRCNHRTGEWRHHCRQGKPLGRDARRWLSNYKSAAIDCEQSTIAGGMAEIEILDKTFVNADKLLDIAKRDQRSIVEATKIVDAGEVFEVAGEIQLEELRWFVYPKEVANLLINGCVSMDNSLTRLGALEPQLSGFVKQIERKRKPSTDAETPKVTDQKRAHSSKVALASNEGEKSTETIQDSDMVDEKVNNKKSMRTFSTWGKQSVRPQVCGPSTKVSSLALPTADVAALSPKKQKFKHVQPPPKLMRTATQAIVQWEMIKQGDKLLLGLSGGKDSLSLLHCLLELQRKLPIQFDIEVCTIDPMTPSFDPSPLIPYVKALGLQYHYIRDDIVARAEKAGGNGKVVSSLCAFCARMKRGNLYSCARENKCNKLVLAQHLDDCAESLMMSLMHNGFLRTMKANYAIDAGDINVIRPLIYCRESLMTEFAKSKNLPVINENCPACFDEPKERARIKKLLGREETLYPNFYDNIRRSLIPLMHDDMASILRSYTEEAVARSRKIPYKETYKIDIANVSDGSEGHSTVASVCNLANSSEQQLPVCNLANASEQQLLRELALRKAKRYTTGVLLSDKKDNNATESIPDATSQVCTLNGCSNSIPCSELME